ncbi:MAG: nucleotidyl transferase AbiEii/AbiGii toxin family protein [Paludibacteraceae bacterium]|nr:nucleotidyl transferase AbiEii/AbiGii toxin family protein [Paludibacteraceae bacterium]
MDINKHKYYLIQVLLAIFRDQELSRLLAFKGGTSLMLFHNLTRFSTDLDFNLLNPSQADKVYQRLHQLLLRFGTIDDEANKFYGPLLVLNYGKGERMLKVEVSSREYPNHYEVRTLLGTSIRVMTMPDMFAHKLCALSERITPRDIYDVWFFLQQRTEINEEIVRLRTGKSVAEFASDCAQLVKSYSPRILMQGLGEVLLDNASKNFVRKQLLQETASSLELFAMVPLIAGTQA